MEKTFQRSRRTRVVSIEETPGRRRPVEDGEASLAAGWLPALAADHGVRILLPRGEIAGDGYELLERACSWPLRLGGPRLVLDLARVVHLDYRGLPVLARIARSLRAEGGDLRLAGASSYLRTILRFVGLDADLREFATVEEAVESFARARAVAGAGR